MRTCVRKDREESGADGGEDYTSQAGTAFYTGMTGFHRRCAHYAAGCGASIFG
jgi:hypothetical protein